CAFLCVGWCRRSNGTREPEAPARKFPRWRFGLLAKTRPSGRWPMVNQFARKTLKSEKRWLIFCDVLALIFTMGLPSLMSWLEFVLLRGAGRDGNMALQISFWLGKVLQFSFPMVYVWFRARDSIQFERPNKRGMLVGIAFGLGVSAGALVLYFGWLRT